MSVIGTGYLGSTHAACMAELGHEVIGVDVDPHKIELLSRGETPFFEPGLDGLFGSIFPRGGFISRRRIRTRLISRMFIF